MRLYPLNTTNGTPITLPSTDIVMVSAIGSNLEIKRHSTSVNLVVTDSINLFNGNGFFQTTSRGISIAINCIYSTFFQTDLDPSKTKVTLGGDSIIVDDTQSNIITKANTASSSSSNIVGEVRGWSTGTAPSGWLLCDGSTIDQSTYSELYTLIGDTYTAVPNGTTFDLPNLSDKVLVGSGSLALGSSGGVKDTTLIVDNLPAHSHIINAVTAVGNQNTPTDNLPANTSGLDREYSDLDPDTTMDSRMVGNTGSGASFTNMQPYTVLNYIIYTGL